jgi:hypothetical protein
LKNLRHAFVVVALLCLIQSVWAKEYIPPDPNDPELLEECWGVRTVKACALCHKVPMTSMCGALPCNDIVVANQDGREAYRVTSGGNQGRVDGDGTPSVLCHVVEYVCMDGQCALRGPIFHQYGVNTAPLGPTCNPGTQKK